MNANKVLQRISILLLILTLPILSCSGVADIPNLFATATLTPTNTLTPTPSPTVTPRPTATLTPSPSPPPLPAGTNLEKQSDGTSLFTDYDNQYRLALPSDWLVIPFQKDAYAEAIGKLSKNNPQLAAAAEAFKNLDPEMFRLVALSTNLNFTKNRFASNLNITAYENSVLANMPLAFVTGALEDQLTQNGMKILTDGVNTIENSQGVDIEYIDTEQTALGNKVVQRIFVFQKSGKLIMIAMTTLPEFSKDVFAEGEAICKSVEFLK